MRITQPDDLVVDTVARLLADVCDHESIERAELDGWHEAAWRQLSGAGFPWVGIDDAKGGSGGTLFDLGAILTAVGRHAAAVPVAETALLGGWLLAESGLTLPDGPVTLAPGAASEGDRLRLDALHVAFARHADRIACLAEVDGEVRVVALRNEQVAVVPGANMAGEARDRVVADVSLDEVEWAPVDRPMSELVDALSLRGALSRVVMASGTLSAMAQLTVEYTHDRKQFGRPVASFQAVQQHLVATAQSAARAQIAADLALRAVAGGDGRTAVAAARVVVDDAISIGTRAAHQAHGAMGVTREYDLHQLTRRLWSWRQEWGQTQQWRRRLGSIVVERGPDRLFELITS